MSNDLYIIGTLITFLSMISLITDSKFALIILFAIGISMVLMGYVCK